MNNKVLITGIDGFTGVHLERCLAGQGYDVYGTVTCKTNRQKYYQCNITDAVQIDAVLAEVNPAYIIHLAAVSFVGETNASLIYDVNVIGSENLLQAAAKRCKALHKVILASSATVYGNQGKEVLDESMCPKPVNHYGISKLAMEHVASNYMESFPLLITRPFNYTGLGQAEHFLIPKIVKAFKDRKQTIELGNLDVSREFNAVDFVSDVYSRLLTSAKAEGVVNIASGRGIALLDVIAMMNEIARYEIQVKVNPAFVRKGEIKSLTGSKEKLVHFIGDIKQKTFKETLQEMYEG